MKKAFTLIELVLVIVVVGILAAIITPKFGDTSLRQAADQIVNHIRYAQHLSMIDDEHNATAEDDIAWIRKRWSIAFSNAVPGKPGTGQPTCKSKYDKCWRYSVFKHTENNDKGKKKELNGKKQAAIDPSNPKLRLTGGWAGMNLSDREIVNHDLNLGKKYGITDIEFDWACRQSKTDIGTTFTFDELGRPYVGTALKEDIKLMGQNKSDKNKEFCTMTLKKGEKNKEKTCTIKIYTVTGYVKIDEDNCKID